MKASELVSTLTAMIELVGGDVEAEIGQLEDPDWLTGIEKVEVQPRKDMILVIALKPY